MANYSGAAAKATPAFRKLSGNHSAPKPLGGAMWDDLVKTLGAGLTIEPLQRGRCSGDCIGTVLATGDCVCY